MHISLFLANKFLLNFKEDKSISSMVKICFSSILIGTFALTLIAAVMSGFEHKTHEKLKGMNCDVVIRAEGKAIDFNKLKPVLEKEFSNQIIAASPNATAYVLAKTDKKAISIDNPIILKSVDAEIEEKVSTIRKNILKAYKPYKRWREILNKNYIFIGQALAKKLNLDVDQTIKLIFLDSAEKDNIKINSCKVKVGAIFKTGINEFDEQVILVDFSFYNKYFNSGVTEISLKLKKNITENLIINKLKKRTGLEVYSWKELYPSMVSALTLEKYAMLIILILVTFVSTMNIISLLFMFVNQKQTQIGILRAMGISDNAIVLTFILIGMILTLTASIIGFSFACFTSWILNYFQLIKLPDVYYVDYLPALINFKLMLLVFCIIIVLSFLSTIIPALKTRSISIANILKNQIT